MINLLKNKIATVLIVIATVILAGVAVFTALRLYQLRKESVVPTVPESQPEATEVQPQPETESCKELTFNLAGPTTTPTRAFTITPTQKPTSTPTPTNTLTPTSTPTTPPGSGGNGENPTATRAPTPTTQADELPAAGVSIPTILGFGFALMLIMISLALVL